jgi:preprotein translocase subunit YajC
MKDLCLSSSWLMPLAQAQNPETVTTIKSEPENSESMTKVPADANAPAGPAPSRRGLDNMSLIIIVLMVVFVFMMFRGPRKKQQEHKKMLQSLQKNDKVRTIGGIYGVVVDVREDEIVLKVDESNNTKIRIAPSAIGTKLSDEKS